MAPNASTDVTSVKLHSSLYTRQAIDTAAATFGDFATFAVRSDGRLDSWI